MTAEIKVTPTQELVLELLASRHRLGEQIWTLARNATVTSALVWLEKAGLVGYKHGVVENSYLAWLTDLGKERELSPTYVPPILEQLTCRVCEKPMSNICDRCA